MASRPSSEDGSFVEDQDVSEEEFDDGLGLAEMSEADAWAATIEAVLPAILVVKTNNTRNVDGFGAGASEATGFIVDLEQGLILTNRHVVTVGPIIATVTFQNKEEVDCVAVYRDPIHDFGFFKFDPKQVKFAKLAQMVLKPESAKIGTEIRVIGNDAGEKLSILSGTLARMDKNAPYYGTAEYSDFNTFYYGAASNTSAGSSGSPVINVQGEVIALNAGGQSQTASSYYLPLDSVVRALSFIRERRPVPRACVQTLFTHDAYNELVRLGLNGETEARIRASRPEETGMLVATKVLKGGATDGLVEPGDILIEINGAVVTTFFELETAVDAALPASGGTGSVSMVLDRSGERVEVNSRVVDLHSLVPTAFLDVGGGVLHNISYIMALLEGLSMDTVVVSHVGYMFEMASMTRNTIISSLNGVPTPNIDICAQVLSGIPDGAYVSVSMNHVVDQRYHYKDVICMDRRFFSMSMFKRDLLADIQREDIMSEVWSRYNYPPPPPPASRVGEPTTTALEAPSAFTKNAVKSLVLVNFRAAFPLEGFTHKQSQGVGIIIDKQRGFVLVDRASCPIMIGVVELTIAGAIRIPANIVFVHPYQNFCLLQFDPNTLGEGALDDVIAEAKLSEEGLEVGDKLTLVGLTLTNQVVTNSAVVKSMDYFNLQGAETGKAPVFRPYNTERVDFEPASRSTRGGLFLDSNGSVRSVWSLFEDGTGLIQAGVPSQVIIEPIRQVISRISSGTPITLRALEAELMLRSIADARSAFGMSPEWCGKMEKASNTKKVLYVYRVIAGTDTAAKLHPGDILLAADGNPLTTLRELEKYCMFRETIVFSVLRDAAVLEVSVTTGIVDGSGTTMDMVVWNGLCLHSTYSAVLQLGFTPKHGCDVFCSFSQKGSPGREIECTSKWLLQVNGHVIKTLDDVLAIATRIPDREYVRLTMQDVFSGTQQVYKVKTDHHFFPIQRFVHNNRFEWERTIVSTPYTSPHTGVQQMRRQSSLLRYEGGGGDSPARKPPRSATPRFYTSPRVRVLGVAAIVALVAVVWKRSNR